MGNGLDSLMVFVSTIGNNGMIWIVIGLGLFLKKTTRRIGIYAFASLLLSGLVQHVLKEGFQRPRPVADPAALLIAMPESYSFPSGHTLIAFCFAGVIYMFIPRAGMAIFSLAALIGISRVYLGVHYLSDVLCGAVIGLGLSYLMVRIPLRFKNWREKRTERIQRES